MPAWTLCLCLGAPVATQLPGGVVTLPVDGTEDVTRAGHAFVALTTTRDTYYVQEPIRLRLRFGVEGEFLKTSMVQLFHRRLDVPVQVQAPWFEGLPHSQPEKGVDPESLSFALSDSVAAATVQERTVAGRQFKVLELERSYLPVNPGKLVVSAPILRFAYATRFQEDFVKGRVPKDRRDALVRGKQLTLRVQPLPTHGRPREFTGAVGRFSVSAEARRREVRLGESFKLVLRIEGSGNLEFFAPPQLDHLKGFHVLGKVDDKGRTRRTVTYDMAPLSLAVKKVPPIRFAFFDPTAPPGYRTVETAPLPLTVRPLPKGARPKLLTNDKVGAVAGVNDIFDIKPVAGTPASAAPLSPSPTLWWILVLSPWLLALVAWSWLRGRARGQDKLGRLQVRDAAAVFRRGTDVPAAFTGFLVSLLGCSAAAVIDPDLKARLEAKGLPTELATRATALLDELVAARYGGNVPAGGEDAARALVDAVETSFQRNQ